MERSFFYCTTLVIALVALSIAPSVASAQEKAGTRAMRREAKVQTKERTEPQPEPQAAQTLTITCEPQEVVVAAVIQYMLPKTSKVSVSVYDDSGREVAVLDNQKRHAGMHQVIFDRRDLPDGVYYCKVVAGGKEAVQRLVLVSQPR